MSVEKTPSPTQLYVSNLPFSYEDDDLRKIFEAFEVTNAYVATRRNGRSKGFGFVTLSNTEQQQKALETVNELELEGRKLLVSVAYSDPRRDEAGVIKEEFRAELPKRRAGRAPRDDGPAQLSETIVYVSNIPFEYSEDDLEQLFVAHAPTAVKIARRRNRSKGFGFVEFPSHDAQQAALALDGYAINGGTEDERVISVKVSKVTSVTSSPPQRSREPREPRERDPVDLEPSTIALYVSNLPFSIGDEELAEIFSSRGTAPQRAHVARRRGNARSKGFGFVIFASEEEQQAALAATQDVSLGDRELSVKVARKGSEKAPEERERAPRARREPRAPRPEKVPSETLVYVANISFDLDDEQLALIFEGIPVKSAHVARRQNGRSKGFGFVDFANHEDQQKALEKNGITVQDREISVEIANQPVEHAE